VFHFDDACSVDFITDVISAYDTSGIPLDQTSLLNSLKYVFLGLDESLAIIIASTFDQDQKKNC